MLIRDRTCRASIHKPISTPAFFILAQTIGPITFVGAAILAGVTGVGLRTIEVLAINDPDRLLARQLAMEAGTFPPPAA